MMKKRSRVGGVLGQGWVLFHTDLSSCSHMPCTMQVKLLKIFLLSQNYCPREESLCETISRGRPAKLQVNKTHFF